jgi:hypothetical protein
MAQDRVLWQAVANTAVNLPRSMKGGEFPDELRDIRFIRKYAAL